jgi:hypothetical protein
MKRYTCCQPIQRHICHRDSRTSRWTTQALLVVHRISNHECGTTAIKLCGENGRSDGVVEDSLRPDVCDSPTWRTHLLLRAVTTSVTGRRSPTHRRFPVPRPSERARYRAVLSHASMRCRGGTPAVQSRAEGVARPYRCQRVVRWRTHLAQSRRRRSKCLSVCN